jgi:hypothetical protein
LWNSLKGLGFPILDFLGRAKFALGRTKRGLP